MNGSPIKYKLSGLSQTRRNLLAAALLFALTLVAYSNSFNGEFHFDDHHQIVRNQNIRDLKNVPRFFSEGGLETYTLGQKGYRPFTLISFALNYAVSGYEVWSWHLFNVLLHIINALLVFAITTAVFKGEGRHNDSAVPLVTALVFALHPIQTGAVSYISGRAVLLATFFYLLAFYGFLIYRLSRGKRVYVWTGCLSVLFMCGLLSKEMAVSLPVMMFAYDLIFIVPAAGNPGRARLMSRYLPYLAVLAVYIWLKRAAAGFVAQPVQAMGVGQYLMSEAKALLLYLRLMVLPVNQNVDYGLQPTVHMDAQVAAAVMIVAVSLYLLYSWRREKPVAAFFGLWFFLAISPESTLVPIGDIAMEYRLYLPSVGFIAALAVLATDALKKPLPRRIAAVSVLAAFTALTLSRNAVWATEYSLWSDNVTKSFASARAHVNLGNALFAAKRYSEATAEYERALRIDPAYPDYSDIHNNLGSCYGATGRLEDAALQFKEAIRSNPALVEYYENLGRTYLSAGRFDEALDVLHKASGMDPGNAPVHVLLSRAYFSKGLDGPAIDELLLAKKYQPKEFDIRYNLALLYLKTGRREKALTEALAALEFAGDEGRKKDAESLLDGLKKQGLGARG